MFCPFFKVRDYVKKIGAKSVFVSSDRDHMIEQLNEALSDLQVLLRFASKHGCGWGTLIGHLPAATKHL